MDKVKAHRSHVSSKETKARGWTRPTRIKIKRRINAGQNSQTGRGSSR